MIFLGDFTKVGKLETLVIPKTSNGSYQSHNFSSQSVGSLGLVSGTKRFGIYPSYAFDFETELFILFIIFNISLIVIEAPVFAVGVKGILVKWTDWKIFMFRLQSYSVQGSGKR